MYSRYTPDGNGGYYRQRLPDVGDRRPSPPPPEPMPGPPGQGPPESPEYREPPVGMPPKRPPRPGPPLPPSGMGILPDLGGLLNRLLPRGLDTEDLLILAVLLLSLKQDGAEPIQLLIALGLYLWL